MSEREREVLVPLWARCFQPLSMTMEPCRFGGGCWRPPSPYGHSGRRAARWAALWTFLACQEDENLEEIKAILGEGIPDRIVEQIDVLAVFSGEAGSSEPGATDTIYAATAAVAKFIGEARPPEIAKHSSTTDSVLVVSSGEAGLSRSREIDTTSAVDMTGAKPVGEARPLDFAKYRATTTAAAAKSVGVPRPPEIAKYGATEKSKHAETDEARPPGIAKYGDTSESELAQSIWHDQCLLFSYRKACR